MSAPHSPSPGRTLRRTLLAVVALGCLGGTGCQRLAGARGAPAAGLARLQDSFARDRFVAYTPTRYDPTARPARGATAEAITEDLRTLRPHFSGLVTYSCNPRHGLDQIVPIAAANSFRVVLGIWDVGASEELECAVGQARLYPDTVVGIEVGNETLLRGGAWEPLERAFAYLRAALPGMPLSTSEPVGSYGDARLRRIVDFHSPNVHWVFQGGAVADVGQNVAWVCERLAALREQPEGAKPLLLKEHGAPSAPLPYTEEAQAEYWHRITRALPAGRQQAVCFFEAFSLGWKARGLNSPLGGGEAQWGAWREDRSEKLVVRQLQP